MRVKAWLKVPSVRRRLVMAAVLSGCFVWAMIVVGLSFAMVEHEGPQWWVIPLFDAFVLAVAVVGAYRIAFDAEALEAVKELRRAVRDGGGATGLRQADGVAEGESPRADGRPSSGGPSAERSGAGHSDGRLPGGEGLARPAADESGAGSSTGESLAGEAAAVPAAGGFLVGESVAVPAAGGFLVGESVVGPSGGGLSTEGPGAGPSASRPLKERPAAGGLSAGDSVAHRAPVVAGRLSPRELEVLHELAAGRSNTEIAKALFLSPGTVKAHLHHIFRKVDATNRLQAVAYAREAGLLE